MVDPQKEFRNQQALADLKVEALKTGDPDGTIGAKMQGLSAVTQPPITTLSDAVDVVTRMFTILDRMPWDNSEFLGEDLYRRAAIAGRTPIGDDDDYMGDEDEDDA